MRQWGKAIIQRVLRDDALREGKHVHTVNHRDGEMCQGGAPSAISGSCSWTRRWKRGVAPNRGVGNTNLTEDQMNTNEVLEKAAEIIQRDGWHQGSYCTGRKNANGVVVEWYGHTGPVCAMGAIRRALTGDATGFHPAEVNVTPRLLRALGVQGWEPGRMNPVVDYNDNIAKSAEDILILFKRAIHDGE